MNGNQIENRKSPGKTVIQMLVGGIVAYGFMMLIDRIFGIKWLLTNSSGPEIFAFTVAMIFTIISLFVLAMSFSRALFTYNRAYADMDAEEFKDQLPILRWSALGMLAMAAMLFLLALAPNGQAQPAYFAAAIGSIVVQLVANICLWKHCDELWRQATKDASTISFCIILIALFVWAAAALFRLGVAFDPLVAVAGSIALYTIISTILVARRGMTA